MLRSASSYCISLGRVNGIDAYLDPAPERVACTDLAALIAGPEPLLALRRRAMRKGIRHDHALASFLQRVVADLAGGVQGLVDVAFFDDAVALGVMGPDAGIAVGLQLDPDRDGVAVARRSALALPVGALEDAGKVLDVVADLVGDDIGLGEIARRAELVLQLPEEVEVEIELLVVGAVERPDRRAGGAAGRADLVVEQDEGRLRIGLA